MKRTWRTAGQLFAIAGTTFNVSVIALEVIYALLRWSSKGLRFAAPGTAVLNLLAFALLCAAAAFGTIEGLKRILPVRGLYQRRQTRLWLRERSPWGVSGDDEGKYRPTAWLGLLRAMGISSTPTDEVRAFNLPNEQVAALVSSALDPMVERYSHTLQVSDPAGKEDPRPDQQLLSAFALIPSGVPDEISRTRGEETSGAYPGDLAQRVRSGVDQLQIFLGQGWRRYVQSAAIWVSGAYGIVLAHGLRINALDDGHLILIAIVIGGPLAWVLRDAAAALERARS